MTAVYIILAIVAGLLLLGQIPLAVGGAYHDDVATLWAKVCGISITLYPRPAKEKKPKKEKKTEKKPKPKKKKDVKQLIAMALDLLPVLQRTVGRFVTTLRMDELKLFIIIPASDDPAEGAIQYGRAQALLGSLWQPLVQLFHIEDGSAGVRVDFTSSDWVLDARTQLSIKLGQLLTIALAFLLHAIRIYLRHRRHNKTGKAD